MFLGIKNNSLTAFTIANLQSQDSRENMTTVAQNVVIQPNSTASIELVNESFVKFNVDTLSLLDASTMSFFCRSSATDAWTPVTVTQHFVSQTASVTVSINDMINVLMAVMYSAEQLAVIVTLTAAQQLVFFAGTAAQKNALLSGLTVQQQAFFTSTPVQFIETAEQLASDKLRMEQIVNKLKNNGFISDDDAVFYALGNSVMAAAAMAEIDAGRGFDGLRNIGLTQPQALKTLSIYNVTIDTGKYESEVALKSLETDPTKIVALKAFLAPLALELPPLNSYLGEIRANHAVYTAIAGWTG
jgi:hypothetical protein